MNNEFKIDPNFLAFLTAISDTRSDGDNEMHRLNISFKIIDKEFGVIELQNHNKDIDYKALLIKYIDNVTEIEGINFTIELPKGYIDVSDMPVDVLNNWLIEMSKNVSHTFTCHREAEAARLKSRNINPQ